MGSTYPTQTPDGLPIFWAPAPSGSDDTAAVEAVIDQARRLNAPFVLGLHAGVHLVNLKVPSDLRIKGGQ